MKRREMLGLVGTVGTVAIAGCSENPTVKGENSIRVLEDENLTGGVRRVTFEFLAENKKEKILIVVRNNRKNIVYEEVFTYSVREGEKYQKSEIVKDDEYITVKRVE